jgi:transglutaminase-like putative cysteine protease
MDHHRFNPAPLARRWWIVAACLAVAAVGLSSPAGGAAAEPEYAVVRQKIKTIKGVDHFEVWTPDFSAKVWVLIAAQPPELPSQSGTSAHLLPDGKPIKDVTRDRALLRAQIPVTKASLEHGLSGRAEYRATLYRRDLVRRESGKTYPPAETLSKTERNLSLAETTSIDFSADVFQRWLNSQGLRKTPDEADLDIARRAFLAITHAYGYEYSETMDRHASVVCQHHKADCGGMCALFAATLRANQVPVRLLLGHLAKSEDPNPPPHGRVAHCCHTKAEFYAQDIGWVPVDLSSAVEYDKTPAGLRYFGHDKGEFITLHLDYDVEFDTVARGMRTARHLQNVRYHVVGNGNLDSAKIDHRWQVETLP